MKKQHTFQAITLGVLIITLLTSTNNVMAHGFNYYLDATTQLLTNDKGEIDRIGLQLHYDKEMSDIILDGVNMDSAESVIELQLLANTIVQDLKKFQYFTQLKNHNKEDTTYKGAIDANLTISDSQRMLMRYTVVLEKPIPLEAGSYQLNLYDPYGTALILSKEEPILQLAENWKEKCEISLEKLQEIPPKEDFKHDTPVESIHILCK